MKYIESKYKQGQRGRLLGINYIVLGVTKYRNIINVAKDVQPPLSLEKVKTDLVKVKCSLGKVKYFLATAFNKADLL